MSASKWRMHFAALYLTLVLLPWMCSGASTSGSKITCDAGKFEIGQPASVTCNFHKNLRESKTSFYVEARFFNSNIQRSVYTCNWLEDSLYCVNDDGFVLRNDDATDHLIIDIREFAYSHAGEYRCRVIDDATPTTEQCFLLPELPEYHSPQSGSSDTVGYTVGVIVPVVVLIVVMGVFVAWFTKRQCRRRRRAQGDDGVEQSFEIVRGGSQTLADYRAESQAYTRKLQRQASSSTNSPRGNEEPGNDHQFKLFRSGSQTQADFETEKSRATSSSSDTEDCGNSHHFELFRNPSQTLADYEAESPENTPMLQTQASSSTNIRNDNEERGNGYQFELERKGDRIYTFSPLKDSPADETHPSESQGQDSSNPQEPSTNAQSPNAQTKFNTDGMLRKPHIIRKDTGLSRDPAVKNVANMQFWL